VRPFSKTLLDQLGASRAQKAVVETFIETPFRHDGKTVRPDGLIRVSFGRQDPWIALVEVKTGEAKLSIDQINAYVDVAREQGFDAVITISNEIAPAPGVHPTPGLSVRANSRVQVRHWSWTSVLTNAVVEKMHRGVNDPEQAWILGELIRYLEHPASGALAMSDMGQSWVAVRDGAREGVLNKRSDEVVDVCQRWDQLMRYASLVLGSEIGSEVQQVLSGAHRSDPAKRAAALTEMLCSDGVLQGALRVPNTAGDIEVGADLRSQLLSCAVQLAAPEDRQARARVTWLLRQLDEAAPATVVESWARNARRPAATATVGDLREDPKLLLDAEGKDISRFRVIRRAEMGRSRKSGTRSQGFVDSVMALIKGTYGEVVQNIEPWVPKAPQLAQMTPEPEAPASQERDRDPAAPSGQPRDQQWRS
jgi:hypothetical protein